jgi:Flp pilus assembly protein TadB
MISKSQQRAWELQQQDKRRPEGKVSSYRDYLMFVIAVALIATAIVIIGHEVGVLLSSGRAG